MKGALGLAAGFVASIVGAGFLSGREIYTFFVAPGPSVASVVAAGLAFSAFGLMVTDLSARWGAASYRDLLTESLGRLAPTADVALGVFVFLTFAVVEAGGGAFVHHVTGLPALWAAAASGLLAAIATLLFEARLPGVQTFLVGLLLLALLASALAVPGGTGPGPSPGRPGGALWPLLYVGYNVMLATSVLPALVRHAPDPRARRTGAVLGGLALGAAVYLVNDVIQRAGPGIRRHPLPMWLAAAGGPPWLPVLVGAALAAATAAALLSYLNGLASRWRPLRRPVPLLLLWAASLPLAATGLATLVSTVYPIMGVASLVYLLAFVIRWLDGG